MANLKDVKQLFDADEIYPGSRGFYVLAIVGIFIAYGLILALTYRSGVLVWIGTLLANTGTLIACVLAARLAIKRYVLQLPAGRQIFAHLFGALLFAFTWFFVLMVFLGVVTGQGLMTFSVRPFLGPAALWQLMQGVSFYAITALVAYVEVIRERQPSEQSHGTAETGSARLFVRDGDEMRPLDTDRIIQIAGAKDYAEVITQSGKHMLRSSLAELERTLGDRFLRVHRSHIVNIDQIERVEPAGDGRLLLHLSHGETLTTSRSGARVIRERTV